MCTCSLLGPEAADPCPACLAGIAALEDVRDFGRETDVDAAQNRYESAFWGR